MVTVSLLIYIQEGPLRDSWLQNSHTSIQSTGIHSARVLARGRSHCGQSYRVILELKVAVPKDLYKTISSNDSRENIYSVCKVLAPSNICVLLNLHNNPIKEIVVYLYFPVVGKEET